MQDQITECIVKLMKAKSVTQSDLAADLKCTQTAVSNLLNGKARLTVDDLNIIARRLGLSINELIAESSHFNNSPINIPVKIEDLITENSLSFYLINRLRVPTSLKSLFEELKLKSENRTYLINLIEILRSHKIIEFNEKNEAYINLNSERVLHYRLTDNYSDRIVEIYKNLRPLVSQAIQNEKMLDKWKEKNLDAFYFEFFTEEQIRKQNEMLREFLNLVKHQIRMNNSTPHLGARENKELRVIFTALSPFPIKEIQGE